MDKALHKILATALAAAMIFNFLPAAMFRADAAPQSVPVNTVPAPCMFLANVATNSGEDTYYTNVTSAGTTFQVAAWINTTEVTLGWVGAFQYNSSQVFCTGVAWPADGGQESYWMYDNGWFPTTNSSAAPNNLNYITGSGPPNNAIPYGSVGEPGFGEVLFLPGNNTATSPFVEELVILTFQFQAGAIPISGSITGYITWDTAVSQIATSALGIFGPYGNYEYTVAVPPPVPDVAVTSVAALKTVVGQGFGVNVTVTAANPGGFAETFNITAYVNNTIFASQNVTLLSGSSENVTLIWNTTGFAYGNYTLSAYAWPVPGETNTANNNCTGGTVVVTIPGDVNSDGIVNMKDIAIIARAFGTTPGSPGWNPNADINNDGIVNMKDIALCARHFGLHYP